MEGVHPGWEKDKPTHRCVWSTLLVRPHTQQNYVLYWPQPKIYKHLNTPLLIHKTADGWWLIHVFLLKRDFNPSLQNYR